MNPYDQINNEKWKCMVLLSRGFYPHFKFICSRFTIHSKNIDCLFFSMNSDDWIYGDWFDVVLLASVHKWMAFVSGNQTFSMILMPLMQHNPIGVSRWKRVLKLYFNFRAVNCSLLPRIFGCPGSEAIALQWYIEWINEITFMLHLF